MTRTSTLSLKFATDLKKNQLDNVMSEYVKVVNKFVDILITKDKVGKYCPIKVQTWLSARLQQAAGKQALEIIKSTRQKDKNIAYKHYKKVYSYFKKKNRQTKFLSKRFSELKLRPRIKPTLSKETMCLDTRFYELQESNNSFDFWLKLGSLGNKIKLLIPLKNHSYNKKYKNWKRLGGIRIKKTNGNNYVLELIYEKEITDKEPKETKELGIDVGIRSLLSCSDNKQLGTKMQELIKLALRKEQDSKGYEKAIRRIKNYVGQEVNKIDFQGLSDIVMENLKNIKLNTRGRVGKTTRKQMTLWNLGLLFDTIKRRCEENRVSFHIVSPKYTSQTCSMCGHIEQGNRNGIVFRCKKCGHEENADIQASKNILFRWHQERKLKTSDIVPDLQK